MQHWNIGRVIDVPIHQHVDEKSEAADRSGNQYPALFQNAMGLAQCEQALLPFRQVIQRPISNSRSTLSLG